MNQSQSPAQIAQPDDEIDLRPYLAAIFRYWQFILGAGLVVGLIVGGFYLLTANRMTANRSAYQVQTTLIPPINVSKEQFALFKVLLTDEGLEQYVAAKLQATGIITEPYKPGILINQAEVTEPTTNTIRFTFLTNHPDIGQQIVTLWMEEYQQKIIALLAEDNVLLSFTEQQLLDAQSRYEAAQAELERFLAAGEINRTDQEIQRITSLIETQQSLVWSQLADYRARERNLAILLRDVGLLRDQLARGDTGKAAESLASLFLFTRSLGGVSGATTLQIDSASLADGNSVTLADAERLYEVLERELQAIRAEIARLEEETDPKRWVDLTQKLVELRTFREQLERRQQELIVRRDQALNSVFALQQRLLFGQRALLL